MKEVVFLNGNFYPTKEARVSVLSPGLLYGWGLFETMRSYKGNIVYFNEHIRRIKDSCGFLKMHFPYSAQRLKSHIRETLELNDFDDARVRLTIWKGVDGAPETLIAVNKNIPFSAQKYKEGFSCLLSEARASENNPLTRHKTTSYLLCQFVFQEAKEKGLDEALILNAGGYLAEGSRSNIFLVRAGELFTPSLECGCLNGITRKTVLDLAGAAGIRICEGRFTFSDLISSEEAFLTNSLIGIMPLRRVNKRKIGRVPHGLTSFLMERYAELLTNGNNKD